MVLITPLQQKKIDILNGNDINAVLYYSLRNMATGRFDRVNFSGNALVAYDGYSGNKIAQSEIDKIISKQPMKGIDYSNNIYHFIGIHLASESFRHDEINNKFEKFDIKNKFAVSLFFNDYKNKLIESVRGKTDIYSKLLNLLFNVEQLSNTDHAFIADFGLNTNADIIDVILYELLMQKFTQFKYKALGSVDLVKQILNNFQDLIKKITTERRKGKFPFTFVDEYDVQDVTYLLLKGIFYDLQNENPFMKKAGFNSIIDLMSEKEKLAIEIKMMLSQYSEKKILEQLKIDIINYSSWKDLKNLIVFVYDPLNKISDRNNFYSLCGEQIIGGVKFNVDVIVSN